MRVGEMAGQMCLGQCGLQMTQWKPAMGHIYRIQENTTVVYTSHPPEISLSFKLANVRQAVAVLLSPIRKHVHAFNSRPTKK